MPEVAFLVPTAGGDAPGSQAYLETESGTRVPLPFAPRESNIEGGGATWARLTRPGLAPITVRSGEESDTYSFTALFADLDAQVSIEPVLKQLQAIAKAGPRVRFAYSGLEAGWWRIERLSLATTHRTERGEIARANVTFNLLADVPPPAQARPVSETSGGGAGWRTHVWKKGDTLFKVAKKYLGKGERWKEIATANKIKDPKKIKPGQKLRIPPK
jgi:hypothetical protein